MPGFGSAPFGGSPYGLGVPGEAALPTTSPAGSRYIDASTRDYAYNATTGQFAQMPEIRQRVLLALLTEQGSIPTQPTFGIKRPQKMGDTFEAEMKAAVRLALQQMTDVEKVLRIDQILVRKGVGGRSETTVVYTDMTTGVPDQRVSFPGG
jgi:phage baseplate assembly protein W